MASRTQQQIIAGLMDRLDPLVESPSMTSMSTMMGSSSTRDDATLDDGETTTVILAEPEASCDGEDGEKLSEFQLKVTKRYLELMGGADRARMAIDKVDECEECLGLIDDDDVRDDSDASMISKMAGMLPGLPDLPMELSNLYNPAAGGSSM